MNKNIKTKTVKQSATFKAAPHQIYELLMDSKKHSEFSGGNAKISRKINGKFTAYDGWIEGKNVKLTKDKEIIQLWRGADWPTNHYSVVKFKLSKAGKGTRLEFTQTGVPESKYRDIKEGWKIHYWKKIEMFIDPKISEKEFEKYLERVSM